MAFGVVLYEMLTGHRAFQGEDVSLTLASVMKSDLNVTRLPHDVPATVRTVLGRCLEKDPKQRVRDIGDVRLAMEGAFETPAPATSDVAAVPKATQRVGWRKASPLMLAALVVGSIITGIGVWSVMRPGPPEPRPITRFSITLSDPFSGTGRHVLAVSQDGRHLVYNAAGQLHLRAMDQLQATPIRGTEGATEPFFSPDGQSIGFWQGGQLKKVSVGGGATVTLCDAANLFGASWGEDDLILYGQGPGGIWQVPSTGGTPEQVIAVEDGEWAHGPQRLPDSEWVLFTLRADGSWDDARIVVQSPEADNRQILINGGRDARYASTGHLVYALESTVLAQAFDPDRLMISAGPVSLLEGVMRAFAGTGVVQYSIGDNGTLAYVSDLFASKGNRLVWVDRTGRETAIGYVSAVERVRNPRLSPDGRRVAVASATAAQTG